MTGLEYMTYRADHKV